MAARNYSNTASVPTLSSGCTALDTVLNVTAHTGMPTTPFRATMDLGGSAPEIIHITAVSASQFTCLRGQDSTAAASHLAGTTITHTATAADYAEANGHINASLGVHGVAGLVVGTTDAQTLSTKTLTTPIINQATHNASSSAPAGVFKAAASGTQDTVQVTDSAGVMLARFTRAGTAEAKSVVLPNDTNATIVLAVKGAAGQTAKLISAQTSAAAEQFGVDLRGKTAITPSTDSAAACLLIKLPATPTGKALEVRDSTGATLYFSVEQDGSARVTGMNLQANGIFDKLNTADNKFRVDSNSALIMNGASVTIDDTQANNVPALTNQTGSKMHWGTAPISTDASGYATIAHGAGFTPLSVFMTWRAQNLGGGGTVFVGADTFTATTFRTRGALSLAYSAGWLAVI